MRVRERGGGRNGASIRGVLALHASAGVSDDVAADARAVERLHCGGIDVLGEVHRHQFKAQRRRLLLEFMLGAWEAVAYTRLQHDRSLDTYGCCPLLERVVRACGRVTLLRPAAALKLLPRVEGP